jgi:hypothetical protein
MQQSSALRHLPLHRAVVGAVWRQNVHLPTHALAVRGVHVAPVDVVDRCGANVGDCDWAGNCSNSSRPQLLSLH